LGVLNDEVRKSMKSVLSAMTDKVKILYFEKPNHEVNNVYDEILEALEEANDKIKVVRLGKDDLTKYNITKLPTIQIMGKNKGAIRYCGLPSGYEFGGLLQELVDVSSGKTHLSKSTIEFLENIDKELHLMVFVTAQCPYCPQAVKLAHDFAMNSDKVVAEMINAPEFMELSQQFHVQGVPHTVINNGKGEFVGAYPEDNALSEIKKSLN